MNTGSDTAQTGKDLEAFISRLQDRSLLRISTAGSVDDGKSTLIGRLLYDSKSVYEDHLKAIDEGVGNLTQEGPGLALLTDGLRAEREQGITIDVAYRYFSTPRRHFILADTPGHEQYTRNMATGCSTADVAVILIDASKGVLQQTRRHAFIASLLGVPRFVLAINKMDLVNYDRQVYERLREEFLNFTTRLDVQQIATIPVSALQGDNIVDRSKKMDWYHGETLLEYLEDVYIDSDENMVDFRLPVQYVIRAEDGLRAYSGQVASGIVKPGEEVMILPSMQTTKIASIVAPEDTGIVHEVDRAFPPMSVAMSFTEEVDVSRGDMVVRPKNVPRVLKEFEAMIVWMSGRPLDTSRMLYIQHTTREARVQVSSIDYVVDVNTLSRQEAESLTLNQIARVSFVATQPLFFDPYSDNRATGNFILIDPDTLHTVAAGMIIDRLPKRMMKAAAVRQSETGETVSENIFRETEEIDRTAREELLGFEAKTLWFTGLSGSGKSTLAKEMERRFFEEGRPVYRLDGDNLRFGLNRDLGFSARDRGENIRRVAEVARLFNEAGVTVLCSFISPFQRDRELAKSIVGEESFVEVYLNTPLADCERRDPKGLYKKARSGEIEEFTGISSPYEAPKKPDVVIDTSEGNIEECADKLLLAFGSSTQD
jgi:bifunctional enzyme CysN/CysC